MAMAARRFALQALAMLAFSAFVLGCSAADDDGFSFVEEIVSSNHIVIFCESYCENCKRVIDVFKELEKPFVVELIHRDDGSDIQDALSEIVGRRTLPQVFILGMHFGGYFDTIEASISGKLQSYLGIDLNDF